MPRRRNRLPPDSYTVPGTVWHITVSTYLKSPHLADPETAHLVAESLRFQSQRTESKLIIYCVMPDHLHAVIEVDELTLEELVRRFKSWTTNRWMKAHRDSRLWQPSFYDHGVRVIESMSDLIAYVVNNPVKAGLVESWETFEWIGGSVFEDP